MTNPFEITDDRIKRLIDEQVDRAGGPETLDGRATLVAHLLQNWLRLEFCNDNIRSGDDVNRIIHAFVQLAAFNIAALTRNCEAMFPRMDQQTILEVIIKSIDSESARMLDGDMTFISVNPAN